MKTTVEVSDDLYRRAKGGGGAAGPQLKDLTQNSASEPGRADEG
jgi:hypothetical protein